MLRFMGADLLSCLAVGILVLWLAVFMPPLPIVEASVRDGRSPVLCILTSCTNLHLTEDITSLGVFGWAHVNECWRVFLGYECRIMSVLTCVTSKRKYVLIT